VASDRVEPQMNTRVRTAQSNTVSAPKNAAPRRACCGLPAFGGARAAGLTVFPAPYRSTEAWEPLAMAEDRLKAARRWSRWLTVGVRSVAQLDSLWNGDKGWAQPCKTVTLSFQPTAGSMLTARETSTAGGPSG
jgi:hypothetical protein